MAGKTILIVEDDGILAIHLKKTLSGFGYTSFASVATGEEAVEIVKNGIPDLILMDIELAGEINGIDTAGIIRSFSDVPVVFLTGYSQEHLIQQAKFTAPAAYLIKPVHAPELHANIEMALYRHMLDRRVKESEDLHKSIDASLRFRNVYHEKRISLSPFNRQDPREIPSLSSHIPENIGRSLAFIEKNLISPIHLDQIARQACMSKFHFCRIFKKYIGATPMQYVITLRLRKAVTLLQRKDLKICDIALKSGFNDLGEFNKQFKKLYGSPPSSFREPVW
ncbi:MAG: helix-turn-helix domain-containing protein [Geobacteraceae bacterium]|nr:helix-turn-helix domain-containing protein [Geobacteraceae bacterium]